MRSLLRVLLVSLIAIALVPLGARSADAGTRTPPPRTGYVAGRVAPDLAMLTAGGRTLKLSQLRGSYVVLDLSSLGCPPSNLAANQVRDDVSALNAPGALDAPVSWVTAEFEGVTPTAAPTAGQLVHFAVDHGIGDLRSPVVGFGALGSATEQAARAQLFQYDVQNGISEDGNAFPTFVVLDPNGVILAVLGGFTTDENNPPSTSDRVAAVLGAQDVPYDLRPAPYSDPTFSSFTLDVTLDGTTGSGTMSPGLGLTSVPLGALPLEAFLGSTAAVNTAYTAVSLDVAFSMTTAEDGTTPPLPLDSTYEIQRHGVTWSASPFKKLTAAASSPIRLLVASSDGSGQFRLVTTQTSMDSTGHVSPVTLRQLVDQAQGDIDGFGLGAVDVYAVVVPMIWTGSINSFFGLT